MKTFVISDTHFFHKNILNFLNKDGSRVRDFESVEEMNETIIQNWNKEVSSDDLVIHLGDICFGGVKRLEILNNLNGRKNLVLGNHEHHNIRNYLPYFGSINGSFQYQTHGIIMSHIPVHESQLEHRWKINIHGHLHSQSVVDGHGNKDLRYLNVCVEQTNFRPVELDEIISITEQRFG